MKLSHFTLKDDALDCPTVQALGLHRHLHVAVAMPK